jgi:hypothetical protein
MKKKMNAVLLVIFVPPPALLIALLYRLQKMNQADDILSFSGSIFRDVSFADSVKKHALLMPYN